MTQEQLADLVGVRRETIMWLEKAPYNPSLKLATDISRVVEAPIEEILIFSELYGKPDGCMITYSGKDKDTTQGDLAEGRTGRRSDHTDLSNVTSR